MATQTSGISLETDVVFGKGGDLDLTLDIYRPPPGSEKRIAVVQLFGGGFTVGTKAGHYEGCFARLAAHGYVSVASQYRLASEGKWPAQIEDVKAAIRWTRAHAAELDVDPDKIAVGGYSAGAHLALMAATSADRPEFEGSGGNAGVSSAVAACVLVYPATSLGRRNGEDHPLMPAGSSDEAYRQASPANYVGAGCPPTILFHGTADSLPHSSSVEVFEKLQAVGVPAELHLLAGLPHLFDRYEEFASVLNELAALFLDRYLASPRLYERPAPGTGDSFRFR